MNRKVIPALTLMSMVGLGATAGILMSVDGRIPVYRVYQTSDSVSAPPSDSASDITSATATPSDIYGNPIALPSTSIPTRMPLKQKPADVAPSTTAPAGNPLPTVTPVDPGTTPPWTATAPPPTPEAPITPKPTPTPTTEAPAPAPVDTPSTPTDTPTETPTETPTP